MLMIKFEHNILNAIPKSQIIWNEILIGLQIRTDSPNGGYLDIQPATVDTSCLDR